MRMRTTEEIVESIDTRLRELNGEIKTLDVASRARWARESAIPTATDERDQAAKLGLPRKLPD